MLKWFGSIIDRACVVVGAILFAQAPLFFKQYTQQLIGREAELKTQVEAMRKAAALSGKTLEQFIYKFLSSQDIDFVHQGEIMQNLVTRLHNLSDALSSLQNSSLIERPFMFALHFNADIFHSTLTNVTFGLPLSIEGCVYALIGMCFGFSVFMGLRGVLRQIFLLFKHKPNLKAPSN